MTLAVAVSLTFLALSMATNFKAKVSGSFCVVPGMPMLDIPAVRAKPY